jgi:MFS family permease
MIRRFGLPERCAGERWPAVASLALCAVSGNFFVLSFARLLAGFGAAADSSAARAGGDDRAIAPERANFLLSLFYAGPGLGILSSG